MSESGVRAAKSYRERECVHRRAGVLGEFYRGPVYVQLLQRLKGSAGLRLANRVSSFFWADAAQVIVWLCQDCAAELHAPASQPD